jgi:hypothetical protein
MRQLRTFILFIAPILVLLVFADPALAVTHGGEGLYGPSDDVAITNTMFILIGFFPALIIVMSLDQAWSDNRRHKKFHAARARELAERDQGGW